MCMKSSRVGSCFCIVMLAVCTACDRSAEQVPPAPLGSPLAQLTRDELQSVAAGEALFNRVFVPESGLGPLFNDNQCSACHTKPVTGGNGEQFVHRQSRFDAATGCDLLSSEGGENVRINATPALRAL